MAYGESKFLNRVRYHREMREAGFVRPKTEAPAKEVKEIRNLKAKITVETSKRDYVPYSGNLDGREDKK